MKKERLLDSINLLKINEINVNEGLFEETQY